MSALLQNQFKSSAEHVMSKIFKSRADRQLRLLLVLFSLFSAAYAVAEDERTAAITRVAPAATDTKVALVIGNSAYMHGGSLKNPVNDAHAMAKKLRSLGFDVVERQNIKAREYGGALREFRSKLKPGSVAVFFYAGHGLQVNGKNYFPAVDADIQGEEDVPNQSLDLGHLFSTLDQSKTRLNLVFLDACRNNPYASAFRSVSTGGLAKVEAPSGSLISYATRPGSVASDGTGSHGLYTSQLLDHLDEPNLSIEQLHKRVVSGVKQASRGMQEPWMEGSIEGEFSFRTVVEVPPAQLPVAQPVMYAPARDDDGALWSDTKLAGTLEAYEWYLERFPQGLRAGLARIEIQKFRSVDERRRTEAKAQAEMAVVAERERLRREEDAQAQAEAQAQADAQAQAEAQAQARAQREEQVARMKSERSRSTAVIPSF